MQPTGGVGVLEPAVPDADSARSRSGRRFLEHPASPYLATALLTSVVVTLAVQLWKLNLRVPFNYAGDAVSSAMHFQTTLETGWFETQDRLGAPYGQKMFDFPLTDDLHPFMIKIFGLFTRNWVIVFNLYYLLGFLLAALAAVWFLRLCGLSRAVTVVLATLYAITPYHFVRNEHHFFLGEYWIVPFALGLILNVLLGRPLWGRREVTGRAAALRGTLTGTGAGTVAIAVLIVLDGAYYGVFTALLLGLAGVAAALARKDWRAVGRVLPALGVIAAAFVLVSLPDWVWAARHGSNPSAAVRFPEQAESFAGKLLALLLPAPYHRIGLLRHLRQSYDLFPVDTEDAALGVVGALGLLVLLALPLVAVLRATQSTRAVPVARRPDGSQVMAALSVLAGLTLLCSDVGGVGTLVAYFVPDIRGWNRMSIFLALVCLAAVGLLLDWFAQWLATRSAAPRAGRLRAATLVAVLCVGFYDQTPPSLGAVYSQFAGQFASDDAFFRKVEASVPAGSMVFQWPYVAFPEGPSVVNAINTEQVIPLLHTDTVRWSGGGVKGRPQIDWMETVSGLPPATMVAELAVVGYQGIVVSTTGTTDHGAAMTAELTPLTGVPSIRSRDGHYLYFSLARALADVDRRMTPAQRTAEAAAITHGAG